MSFAPGRRPGATDTRAVRAGAAKAEGSPGVGRMVRRAGAWMLLSAILSTLGAQGQRLTAEAVLRLVRQGVTESRIVVLIVQGCVIEGNDRAQRILQAERVT